MEFKLNDRFLVDSPVCAKYTDCIIHVADKKEGKKFKVHKMILAQHSPYLDRIFQCSENIPLVHICFSTAHPASVENALKLMYGNRIETLTKHSKHFCEFLALLEVKYTKEPIKSEETHKEKRKDLSSEAMNASPDSFGTSSVMDMKNERLRTVGNSGKRGKEGSPEKPGSKKMRQTEPPHEYINKANKLLINQELEDSKSTKWTETTADSRLENIDFEVKIMDDTKRVYQCCHCEDTENVISEAEKHFMENHQGKLS